MEKRKKKKKVVQTTQKKLSHCSLPAWEWSGSLFCFARRSPTSGCSEGFQKVLLFHYQRDDSKNWKETRRNLIIFLSVIYCTPWGLQSSIFFYHLGLTENILCFFTAGKMCTAGVSMYLGAGTVTTWVMVCQTLVVLKDSPLDDESVSMLLNSSPL